MKILAVILGVSGVLGLSLNHENAVTDNLFSECDHNHSWVMEKEEANRILSYVSGRESL